MLAWTIHFGFDRNILAIHVRRSFIMAVRTSIPLNRNKRGAHICPSDVEKEHASHRDTHHPLNNPAEENVNGVSQKLRRDDSYGQLPSPPAILEPADSSERESHRKRQKQQTYRLSEWCKVMVGVWIQNPHTVKSGAASYQTSSGKERHHGPKQQENTNGSGPTRWCGYGHSRGVIHSQTINLNSGLAPDKRREKSCGST
jgi:hypothetical protein